MSVPPTPRPAGNVLIVEDDPDVREMLAALLVTEGFHPVAAEDGWRPHLLRAVGATGAADPGHDPAA